MALSSAEAEYIALSAAYQEAVWLRQLYNGLGGWSSSSTSLQTDSQSAMAMSENPRFHGRAKHIEIKYHYIRDRVQTGEVKLQYCPTTEMVADVLTKALSSDKHVKFARMMNVVPYQ